MRAPILLTCLAAALLSSASPRPPLAAAEEPAASGGWVRGVVQRPDGTPIAGARLTLYARSTGRDGALPAVLASVESNTAGEFALGPLKPFPHFLRMHAEAPGAEFTAVDSFVGATAVVRLRPVGSIRGRVLSAESGEPLPDASVQAGSLRDRWWGSTKSAADGAFLIEGVPEGTYSIEANLATVGAGEVAGVQVSRGRVAEPEVWVAGTPDLRGTVRTADGRPIGGATVEFEGHEVRTAEDGFFRVCSGRAYMPRPSSVHEWTARASAPGFEPATLKLIATRGGPIPERSFTLRAEAVKEPKGGADRPPAPALRIQVTRGGKAVPGALVATNALSLLGVADAGLESTDADGFAAATAGPAQAGARRWARTPEGELGVVVAPGPSSNPPGSVIVPVGAPAMLTGIVKGPYGKPELGAMVRIFEFRRGVTKGATGDPLLEIESDSSGAWRTPWVPGAFLVDAESGTARSAATRVDLAGAESKSIVLALVAPAHSDLIGHVVDDSGAPLEGADVSDKAGNYTTTARDGSFRLPGSGDSFDTLRVDHPDCIDESPREVIPVQGGVKVVLRRGGEIRGRLVSAGDGAPVRFAWVYVQEDPEERYRSGNSKWQVALDREGRFRVRGLRATTLSVFAVSGDRASDVIERVSSRDGKEIRLALRPGGTVKGTVRDGRGKPLSRVAVGIEASLLEGFKGGYCHFKTSAETDDAGGFQFVGLPSGVWLVTLPEAEGYAASQRRVTIAAGETKTVGFVRAKPGVLKVHVVDSRGRSVNGASISIETADGVEISPDEQSLREYFKAPDADRSSLKERCERTGRDGVACWPGLEPGKYTVKAIAGLEDDGVATAQVREGDTTSVRLVVK